MSAAAWQAVLTRLDDAAALVGLDPDVHRILRRCERALEVSVPVRMDDGSVEVFTGWRVHHEGERLALVLLSEPERLRPDGYPGYFSNSFQSRATLLEHSCAVHPKKRFVSALQSVFDGCPDFRPNVPSV